MINADEKQAAAAAGLERDEREMEGAPRHFEEVIRTHGRAMFNLVYASGVAGHGHGLLAGATQHPEARTALRTLAEMHNIVAKELIKAKGWTQGDIDSCDAAIRKTMDTKIIMPGDGRLAS